jgi:hypothetical protein
MRLNRLKLATPQLKEQDMLQSAANLNKLVRP